MKIGRGWKNGVQEGKISHNQKWLMFVKEFAHYTNQKLCYRKKNTKTVLDGVHYANLF